MNQRDNLPADITKPQHSVQAPTFEIPPQSLINIEHPFIIQNISRAVDSLGGLSAIQALAQGDIQENFAKLYLHPGDPMTQPIKSLNVNTNNMLLQITVPKRTGVKRKRSSPIRNHENFSHTNDFPSKPFPKQSVTASNEVRYLLRSLKDNVEHYEIKALGSIYQTHRFRDLPDFVYSTQNSPFMKKMRENILTFEYEKMKAFRFDKSKGPRPNTDLIPPPRWSHITIPFNYSYLQNNPSIPARDGFGNLTISGTVKPLAAQNQPVSHDCSNIPDAPADDLPSVSSLEPAMQRLIENARLLFEERPIWTRRALRNRISQTDWKNIGNNQGKYVYQYVGYLFESGPWRDAIVKFGVDPRKDPNLRVYQTMMFMLDPEHNDNRRKKCKARQFSTNTTQPTTSESHIFDGEKVSLDGKVWQVCDITDPLLKSLLSTSNLREECNIQCDGWYHSGTWAKAKIIMKAKIVSILAGQSPDDIVYKRAVFELPEIIDIHTVHLAHYPRNTATPFEVKLAGQIRTAAKKYHWNSRPAVLSADGEKIKYTESVYGYRQNGKATMAQADDWGENDQEDQDSLKSLQSQMGESADELTDHSLDLSM